MMLLRCVKPFGNFVPGDEVEVPDGSVYDSFYFEEGPAVTKAEVKPAAIEEVS